RARSRRRRRRGRRVRLAGGCIPARRGRSAPVRGPAAARPRHERVAARRQFRSTVAIGWYGPDRTRIMGADGRQGRLSVAYPEATVTPSAGGGTVPLSEHEQRMLEQIESALYAEDPKFASSVRGGRLRTTTSRRRLQAAALFALGLLMLVAGIAGPVKPGGFPIISLIGFIVMFGAGVLLLLGGSKKAGGSDRGGDAPSSG